MWWVGTKKKYQIKEKFSIYPIRSHYFERIQNVGFSFEIIKKLKFSVDFQKFSVKNTKILRKIWTFTVNSNELKMSDFHWQNPKMSEIVVSYRFSDIFWSKNTRIFEIFQKSAGRFDKSRDFSSDRCWTFFCCFVKNSNFWKFY